MKKERKNRLPPIFKMSVLWNILPYYGHLHTWRMLLGQINRKSRDIWAQNRNQLAYIGKNYRKEIEIIKDSYIDKQSECIEDYDRSWLDLYLIYFNLYNLESIKYSKILNNLQEDEVIIIDPCDDLFIDYQIHYCKKDKISEILPSVNWPSFIPEIKTFKNSEKKVKELIESQIYSKSLVIGKWKNRVSIYSANSETLKITPETFQKI